jgi:hypothetical protein
MKFVHKAYQPVLYHGIPNLQRSDDPASEYWQWWEEQYRRCLHGYKPDGYEKIAGRYYFYLNFCKIKMSDGTREFISHPYYRDLDHELSEIFEQAKREHKGIILPKAREKGITYDCLGQAILHEVVFYEGSEVGIGTAIPKYMEKDKLVLNEMYNRLPLELMGGTIRKNEDYWKFGISSQEVLPSGERMPEKESGIRSVIHFRPNFNKIVDGFNSLRLSWAFYDECGLMNKMMTIHNKNLATFMRGDTQFGTMIYGGTAKSFDSKDNDYEKMYDMADDLNLIKFEVYARKALHGFIDYNTGKSDEVGAQKWIDEKMYKPVESDKLALAQRQQEYPSEPEHFWMRKSGGILPLGIINDQIKNIKADKRFNARTKEHGLLERGDLKWVRNFGGEVEWHPNPKGEILIYQHPKHLDTNIKYNNLYVGGVDPYNKVETVETDSMGACVIYKRFIGISEECEMPVLEYVDRPTATIYEVGKKFQDKDVFYNNLFKIARYYDCKLLVEDTDTQLFAKFKEWSADYKVLAPIPTNEVSARTNQKNRYGISPTEGVKVNLSNHLDSYLKAHPESILFLRLLQDLRKWGAANTDIAIAFGYCLLYDSDLNAKRRVAKEDKNGEEIQRPFGAQFVRRNGKLVCVTDDHFFYGKQSQTVKDT